MPTLGFYDVKNRKDITAEVTKVAEYTVNGQTRFAAKGKTEDGRNLTKFINKETAAKLKEELK